MTHDEFEHRLYEILRERDPLYVAAAQANPEGLARVGALSIGQQHQFDAIAALFREATAVSLEDHKAALQRASNEAPQVNRR